MRSYTITSLALHTLLLLVCTTGQPEMYTVEEQSARKPDRQRPFQPSTYLVRQVQGEPMPVNLTPQGGCARTLTRSELVGQLAWFRPSSWGLDSRRVRMPGGIPCRGTLSIRYAR